MARGQAMRSLRSWMGSIVVVAACLGAPACATDAEMTGNTASAAAGECSRATSSPRPLTAREDLSYQTEDHVFMVRGIPRSTGEGGDVEGALWRVTVSVFPWLPGSDQSALKDAWNHVSGLNEMPLSTGEYERMTLGGHRLCLDSQRAAYLFGTVSFEDASGLGDVPAERVGNPPPYPTLEDPGYTYLLLSRSEDTRELLLFQCYIDGCGHTANSDSDDVDNGDPNNTSGRVILVSYPVLDATPGSGPHPFVVAVPEVFSEEYHDGENGVSDLTLRLASWGSEIDPAGSDDGLNAVGAEIPTSIGW